MKNICIFVAILLVIVTIIVFVLLKFDQDEKDIKLSNIEKLDFYYTQGYMVNSDIRYELKCKDECLLTYKPFGIPYEKAKKYKVSSDVVFEIESLLNKYKVYKWNGFHENNKNVLDGDSFGFYVYMKNGEKIEASGYMSWPDNYGKVKSEFKSIFDKVITDS